METLREEQLTIELNSAEESVKKKALELQKAIAEGRFNETQQGMLLIKLGFEPLKLKIDEYFKADLKGHRAKTRNFISMLNSDSASISYMVLFTMVKEASNAHNTLTITAKSIIETLLQEFKINKLKKDNPKLHTYLGSEFRRASKKRKEYLIDKHLEYMGDITYTSEGQADILKAGVELINLVLLSGSDMFDKILVNRKSIRKGVSGLKGSVYQIKFTKNSLDIMDKIDWVKTAQETANLLPMIVPPEEWTTTVDGGYLVNKRPMLSVASLDVRKWQRKQDFSKIYPIINKLQATAWKVNSSMLDLIQDVVDGNIIDPHTELLPIKSLIGGLPTTDTAQWYDYVKKEDYKEEDWSKYNRARERQNIALDSAQSKRMQLNLSLGVAHTMRDYKEFYYTYQLDYRGRMYPVSAYLSHQGQSYSKAILEFAEGRELTEEGFYWLKIHTANVYGLDKILFSERVKWFEENRAEILLVANNPLSHKSLWINADSPFEYVAACKAYKDHIEGNKVHLPIQLDAICSGISIYSGLLLDEVGAMETAIVNKVGESGEILRPDIYKTVATKVNSYLAKGEYPKSFSYVDREGKETYATSYKEATSITGKVTRSIVKRNVMTVPYSVTMKGMSNQLWDIMDTATTEGVEFWEGEKWIVNKLLTQLNHRAIYDVVQGARIGQDYLVSLSKLLNKQAEWVTPLYSFPIKQTSLKTKEKRVQTIVGTLSLRVEVPKLDTRKQSQSIAPNFIHSLDSEILKYCIDKMDTGIGVIHDCVLVHPNDGYKAQDKYREGYVKLMELHPLEHISKQLDPDGKLKVPDRGELKLKDVYKSKYIIS